MIGLMAMMAAASVERVMLPDAVVPVHYDVHVAPDARAMTFTGDVGIDVEVRQATDRITLNAADLTIDAATLDGGTAPLRVDTDRAGETITVHAPAPLSPGRHRLSLRWHGRISTFTSGFFALDYQGPDGPKRMIATKFEPAAARRFMPLWDEPARKATYTLSADVPAAEMAISNMPAASSTALPGGLKRVTFARSPKMSSYLLFFASGDFARVSRKVGGTDVGVIVRKGAEARTVFALDAAAEVLPFFNDYFGTPYALPKLDLIAGPGVGSFGAMENWGAIFFFESRLLVDPVTSTAAEKQGIWSTVAHEIAHQWFGNLVTMAWWDDLWLNEGFASWMEGKAAERLHPEWRPALQALRDRERALALDALPSTHPVITDVRDGPSANQAFDGITYGKGQAVIATLEAQVGEAPFRDGVRAYMRDHAYANTVNDDLWTAVERASRQPVKAIAADFLGQAGVPLVTVAGDGRLGQRRFSVDGAGEGRWTIPLAIARPGGDPRRILLTPAGTTAPAPVLANAGQSTYARVAYDGAAFAPLIAGYAALPPVDQLGLMLDAWALGQTPAGPAERPLALIATLPAASPLWSDAVGILSEVDRLHRAGPARDAFRAWASRQLARPWARIGWDARPGEAAGDAALRDPLVRLLGRWGDPAIVAEARRRAGTPGPLAKATAEIVAGSADAATFARLRAEAKAATDAQDKADRYAALAAVRDPGLAQQLLEIATGGEAPSSLASSLVIRLAAEHPDLAWRHAVATHGRVAPNLDLRQRYQYLPNVAQRALTAARADELRQIAARDYPDGSRRFADQAETALRQRARVADTRIPDIDRWVAAQR